MPYTIPLLAYAALLFGVFLFLVGSARKAPPGSIYPPGPKRQPIIGNLLQIPGEHSWIKFHEWSQIYGTLYGLDIAGRKQVILSSEETANDLLGERGNVYSSRE